MSLKSYKEMNALSNLILEFRISSFVSIHLIPIFLLIEIPIQWRGKSYILQHNSSRAEVLVLRATSVFSSTSALSRRKILRGNIKKFLYTFPFK